VASPSTETRPPVLELQGVTRLFGALRAVDDVTFSVREGARHAVIGPNGAGKSTLLNLISGHLPASSGTISFIGQDIGTQTEDARARLGLAKTFQHSSLFNGLTAEENVALAVRRHRGVASKALRLARKDRDVADAVERCLALATLEGRNLVVAGELSHGERRQLEVAMALATEPRLILFDEPVAGMSAAETSRFIESVRSLPTDLTLMLVEHDMEVVFSIAERITVLHAGRVLEEGTPAEISASAAVQEAYLGHSESAELFTS
jgi:branched-chain amino acid transport system ATP-binding protein